MIERKINKIKFPKNALDVLAQQIYGMAIYKIWEFDEIFELIRKSYCYHTLSRKDFLDVISYLAGEYALEKSHVYAKIWYDSVTKQIGKKGKMARVMYMTNIGTIPEESFIKVKLAPSGEQIGMIDEGFLGRMKKGDVFVLGGQKYMYAYTRGMNLYVRGDIKRPPTIPSWFSEMLPLSFDSAIEINRFRKLVKERMKASKKADVIEFIKDYLYTTKATAIAVYNYFYEQHKFLEIPDADTLIIERYHGEKNQLIFHSMFGRRVNDVLSRALGYLMARSRNRDIEMGINDNGFYLAGSKLPIEKALDYLTAENLEKVLSEAVERTDVLSRRFRHCATRALMILRSYKGISKTVGKQQMRSHFLLNTIRKLTKNFPILREARREVLEDLMDIENAKKVIQWIKDRKIKIKIIETPLPSPFALNLILQGHSDLIKMEDKQAFLRRMHEMHMQKVGK
jgi:ATP-dependent Lhr-like helicase